MFNDADLALQAVLQGRARPAAELPVRAALDAGLAVSCTDQYAADDRGHYLCYLSRRQLPKRIRAFIDFITSEVRALDTDVVTHWESVQQASAPARDVDAGAWQ